MKLTIQILEPLPFRASVELSDVPAFNTALSERAYRTVGYVMPDNSVSTNLTTCAFAWSAQLHGNSLSSNPAGQQKDNNANR